MAGNSQDETRKKSPPPIVPVILAVVVLFTWWDQLKTVGMWLFIGLILLAPFLLPRRR